MTKVYFIDRDKLEIEPLLPVEHPKVGDMVTVAEVKPCPECAPLRTVTLVDVGAAKVKSAIHCNNPKCKDGWVIA